MKYRGSIRVDIQGRDEKVLFTYLAEPTGHYDIEPYSDLVWWFDNKEIDPGTIDPEDRAKIEVRLLEIVNDSPEPE